MNKLKYPAVEIKNGYTKIVEPGNSPLEWIEFGILQLEKGGEWSGETKNKEAVFLLQSGAGDVTISGNGIKTVLYSVGPRNDIFKEKCSLVYIPPETGFMIKTGHEFLSGILAQAPAPAGGSPFYVTPEMIQAKNVGKESWQRTVSLATIPECGAKRLLVGETINPPGKWSSYPPHKHDRHIPEKEVPLEEVYHYRFQPEKGFALQRIYDSPGTPDRLNEALIVENRDTVVLPRGYHPLVAAPGYTLCYTWILAGETLKYGSWSNDPDHEWLIN